MCYVTRDFPHRSSNDTECSGNRSDTIALSVPGQIGDWKSEFHCQEFSHLNALVSEGSKGSGSTTQLHGQRSFPMFPQCLCLAQRGCQPARGLKAERNWQRLL